MVSSVIFTIAGVQRIPGECMNKLAKKSNTQLNSDNKLLVRVLKIDIAFSTCTDTYNLYRIHSFGLDSDISIHVRFCDTKSCLFSFELEPSPIRYRYQCFALQLSKSTRRIHKVPVFGINCLKKTRC